MHKWEIDEAHFCIYGKCKQFHWTDEFPGHIGAQYGRNV